MQQSIGFLELNSIARGVGAADAMVKAAEVELLYARPNCPGKFNILICGEVAAIEAGMEAGTRAGGSAVLEDIIIPRLHPQVIPAIHSASQPDRRNALGIMEFFSIASAILAADRAVKAADVNLMDIRLGYGLGGKSYVALTGDTSAVIQATDTGTATARERGSLVDCVVIPNPSERLYDSLL